jgi:Fic family protein
LGPVDVSGGDLNLHLRGEERRSTEVGIGRQFLRGNAQRMIEGFANKRSRQRHLTLSETHQRLMRGVRGAGRLPGEVRRSQNWIGGSRPGNAAYVPPPPNALGEVLGAFEEYLHSDDTLPPLVRAGLLHVQFETIHPYLDGNGRIGRLLVTLLLEQWRLLTRPLLS